MKLVSFLLCLLSVVGGSVLASAQAVGVKTDAFARSTQMIVVTAADWDVVEGKIQRFERDTASAAWHPVGEPIAIVVGNHGMGWGVGVVATDQGARIATEPVKKEGDGKSPAGIFALGTAFGYDSQPLPGSAMPYLNLTPTIECVDDIASKHYNRIVDSSTVVPDWNSSEHMRNVGEAYRWGIVVDHNGVVTGQDAKPPQPGGGSCVFLHIWHSPSQGTAGCTAMPQIELENLLRWLDPKRNPLLVQLPEQVYERLADRWSLPKLNDTVRR
jgi:D-alanyl-D-alanine dipeptidase